MGKTEYILVLITFNLVVLSFIFGIVLYIKQYKKKKKNFDFEILANIESHKKELLSTQLEMQLQTMQHIGREIHDNVGQKLTLASLYTQQLSYENKAPIINDKIENISSIINESLQELRRLSKSLTDDNIAEQDFISLLKEECKKINDLNKCNIVLNTNLSSLPLSYQTKSILLRVVQEFFQNSIKHSKCKTIILTIEKTEHCLVLYIEDDGVGFDAKTKQNTGIGLKNMQKRIELINGIFEIKSILQNGTKASIKVPLQHEA
jgi:signal transduction histidine kinase